MTTLEDIETMLRSGNKLTPVFPDHPNPVAQTIVHEGKGERIKAIYEKITTPTTEAEAEHSRIHLREPKGETVGLRREQCTKGTTEDHRLRTTTVFPTITTPRQVKGITRPTSRC